MNCLVTGGAGYIGSHAVKQLVEKGHRVTVVDDLSRGHRAAVHEAARLEVLDVIETNALARVLERSGADCVLHFAALAYVGESVREPLRYYRNNTAGTVSLLEAMTIAGVPRLVFSSTCATYGEPASTPIREDAPQVPINPYGRSKWFVEQILADYAALHLDFGFVALRYFNVAGAASDSSLGEDHDPETHLIPIVLEAAAGKRDGVTVYGRDYPTADGSCIRDYVHVDDLCAAHLLAMDALRPGDRRHYNIGIGRGYSVLEVIDAARRVTGREIRVEYGARRPGDPAILCAAADRIGRELGWTPRYTDLDPIVATAWRWMRDNPDGYRDRDKPRG